ncbi:MAG: ATP-dependent sacrificial sulfur transferase LarE [Deltaproteobacteria bacterium]|nr:ATP-dependent sacrificial sulfur transferase LarE [Deltaproteobacteria bacterium]
MEAEVIGKKRQEVSLPQLARQKHDNLRKIILEAQSVVVAFSGGVDSTFLLKVCVDLLRNGVLAITARSETFPKRELEEARYLAKEIGAKHIIIDSEELRVPGFSDNPPNRCFLCKTELFSKIKKIAASRDIRWVFDGSNADDPKDFRPGRMAAKKLGICSPLEEVGLTKEEIRVLSKSLNLSTWDKPSFACLSSRFPYYTKITELALRRVEDAENYLFQLGMRVFRVRHYDTLVRIELGEKEMSLFGQSNLRNQVVKHFKSLGYKYVTLDLEGYRTGSMNEALTKDQRFLK